MNLRDETIVQLKTIYGSVKLVSESPAIWHINSFPVNLRTASRKAGDKFWFDVTPELYEKRQVEYFLYACGAKDSVYVFPRLNFEHLVRGASLGGQKQVPNFTVYLDTDTFEPAGKANSKVSIAGFKNAFFLIPN